MHLIRRNGPATVHRALRKAFTWMASVFLSRYLQLLALKSVDERTSAESGSGRMEFGFCAPQDALSVMYITEAGREGAPDFRCMFSEGEMRRAPGPTDNIHKMPPRGPADQVW
jgi:hypothetical protein